MADASDQHSLDATLPKHFKLLPGEHLLEPIALHPRRMFDRVPSSLEQMTRLTKAKLDSEIGRFGPSQAATTFDDEAPEHLKLYETLFGRDSLRVAIDLISIYPELARTTIMGKEVVPSNTVTSSSASQAQDVPENSNAPVSVIAKPITAVLQTLGVPNRTAARVSVWIVGLIICILLAVAVTLFIKKRHKSLHEKINKGNIPL